MQEQKMISENKWSTKESHLVVWWLWKDASNNPEPHHSRCFSVAGQYFRLCVLYQLFVVVLSLELGSQTLIGKEMPLCRSCRRSVSHLLWSFLLDLSKVKPGLPLRRTNERDIAFAGCNKVSIPVSRTIFSAVQLMQNSTIFLKKHCPGWLW